MNRVKELEKLITYHQDKYYNGEAEISDADFDSLWDELKTLDASNPILKKAGADSVDGFPKAQHIIPMGSQDKAANNAEFIVWAEKTKLPFYLVQHKLDGASLELQYENGRFIRAVTRGDGAIGDDITANAKKMTGVLSNIESGFSGGIRGEVVMFHDVWKKKYSVKANCRNAANGLMKRKDGRGSEDLTVIVYDVSSNSNKKQFAFEKEKIQWLKSQGFITVKVNECKNAKDVIKLREKEAEHREKLPYDIDGLVVKNPVVDIEDLKKTRPEKQIAFKFELEKAVSELIDVEWSESGAIYTPIGIVSPVRLAGTTVKRANLCNPLMIKSLNLKIGSRVVIVKRGEIIPKIEGLSENENKTDFLFNSQLKEIEIPSVCGTCKTQLIDDGTRLYCPNTNCPKRLLHRIKKWVKILDIRELGDKLINQLFEKKRIQNISDLYLLKTNELSEMERMGEISSEKVVRNIQQKRQLSLPRFIAGFDFEGIGETLMEAVCGAGFDTLEKLRGANIEELASVFGIGEERAKTIIAGLQETAKDMDAVLDAHFVSIVPPLNGKGNLSGFSFCFTGELESMKRAEAAEKIKGRGGSVKSAIVKGLSYLVTNTPESGSAKNKKARELNISIISEKEFLEML